MLKDDVQYTMTYGQLQKIASAALGKNFSSDKLRATVRSAGIASGQRINELKAKQILQNFVGYDTAKTIMTDFHTQKMKWILSNRASFYADMDKKKAAVKPAVKKDLFIMKGQLK
ncbi:hypothetical protein HY932_01990 [Candidatus Falkowbacteria bacterium]|nr:hypothetical protein [Candidatus Falkowbacteria bacterium]